jgi:1-acyl-sn-glycerol-3-phosphate acyltransferase
MVAPGAPWHYRCLQRVVGWLVRTLAHWDLTGLEHVPAEGALIVAPNHIFLLDVVIMFVAIPRRVTAFAAEEWRGTPGGRLMDLVASPIYVQRGEVDRQALSKALAVLRGGGTLGVAPEGTRSRTGGLQAGKDGVAYLAGRSGALVLPVASWGQEQVLHRWARLRRPVVHVHIGQPLRLPPEAVRARPAELAAYTEQIMLALARMLPAEYRGVYASKV